MVALLAYGLMLAVAALGVLWHPGAALFGYYLVAFMRPMELHPDLVGARLSMPLVLAALAGAVVYVFRKGVHRERNIQVWVTLIMVAHFAIAGELLQQEWRLMLGHQRGLQVHAYVWKLDYYVKLTLVLWVASRVIDSPRWVYRIALAFCLSVWVLGYWANYRYAITGRAPVPGPGPHMGVFTGIFKDRNDFGMFLAMGVVCCWYMAQIARSKIIKAAWLSGIPVIFHAILLTESRGALLGGIAGLAYVTWRSPRRWLMAGASLAGLVIALTFFASDKLIERYTSRWRRSGPGYAVTGSPPRDAHERVARGDPRRLVGRARRRGRRLQLGP